MSNRPRTEIPFHWPDPAFHIVLVEPDIPQNTGNIARLCAATGTTLDLVEPLGFQLTDKHMKRAGLDYWDAVAVNRFSNLGTFQGHFSNVRKLYFSTNGSKNYSEADYRPGDCLIFGSESKGLPLELLEENKADVYNIPIQLGAVRSLNLANASAIVLYEALRQLNSL